MTVDPPAGPIAAGGTAVYTITVTNQGTSAETVSLAAASDSADVSLMLDTSSLGSIAPGGNAVSVLTASAKGSAPGSAVMTITASGQSGATASATIDATVFAVSFDRTLQGDQVGQHKVPPSSKVTVQISVRASAALPAVTLTDHFPADWAIVDAKGGTVAPAGSPPSISWDLGPVAEGGMVTTSYDLVSPELTLPPTSYDFASELSWQGGDVKGDAWQVLVSDPSAGGPDSPYATALSSSSIGIAWVPSHAPGITGYKVYRSATSGGTYALIMTTTGGQLTSSVEDGGLPASTTYYYWVSAYDATGESSLVGPVSATTAAPAPPKGPRATGGSGSISLDWSANAESNLAGYNVYRSATSGGTFAKLNSALVTSTAYVDAGSGLSPVGDYYYRIAAVDATGAEGKPSGEVTARLLYNLPTTGPHGGYSATTDTCATCHRTHSASGSDLTKLTRERDLCLSCHDGTGSQYDIRSALSGSPTSSHPVLDDTLKCSSCHDSHLSPKTTPKLLDVSGSHSGNAVCYSCHGNGSTLLGGDHQTPWEASYHKSAVPTSPSGTGVQCSTCHLAHGSPSRSLEVQKDENTCYSCHDGSTAGANVLSKFTASGSPLAHHAVSDSDQAATGAKLECANCHNSHTTASASKVVNPDSPAMANVWTGSTTTFCLSCHDGTYPTGAQTEPYASAVKGPTTPLVNVAATYGSSPHSSLSCVDCHDSHGSPSPYMLKTSVTPPGGSVPRTGLIVAPATGGYDTRFFCNACHDVSQMGNGRPFPTDCVACHKHGDGL